MVQIQEMARLTLGEVPNPYYACFY